MSRTVKWEHPTDGFNTQRRLERQARPAGRYHRLLAEALDELYDLAEIADDPER
jgi:hypothetical protein